MDTGPAAAVEVARRQIKRASGLLRDATRSLAAAAESETVLGVVHVHDAQTLAQAQDLIRVGVGHHGAVDVLVVASPAGRRPTPPRPRNGAKEQHTHGTHEGP